MRNKLLYMSGSFINGLGDGLQLIAMNWFIYKLTGSALSIGIMITSTYLPSLLFSIFLGVIVDNRDSKQIAVLTDFFRAFIVGIMVFMIFLELKFAFLFYALQFVLAILNAIFKSSSQALVRETFTDENLIDVLSKTSSLNQLGVIIGSGIAGVIVAVYGPIVCFVMNAMSFLVSSACNMSLKRITIKKIDSTKKINMFADLSAGWNFVRSTQGLLYMFFLSLFSSFCFQMINTILVPFATDVLNGNSFTYSLLDVFFTLGCILAGYLVTLLLRKLRQMILAYTMAGMAIVSGILALTDQLVFGLAVVFVLGGISMTHFMVLQSLIQINTPKELTGRISSFRSTVVSIAKIGSALFSGSIAENISVSFVLMFFSLICFMSLLTHRKLRVIQVPEKYVS
jgi:DHA3 family macrolide efflux protein-like MFS transporter